MLASEKLYRFLHPAQGWQEREWNDQRPLLIGGESTCFTAFLHSYKWLWLYITILPLIASTYGLGLDVCFDLAIAAKRQRLAESVLPPVPGNDVPGVVACPH